MAINVPAHGHGPQVTLKEYIPRVTHKLCSVFPRPFYFHDANGQYELKGCKPGQPFSFVEIQPGYDKYDLGEDKHVVALAITAKDIAKDYAMIHQGSDMYTSRGVFVPEGEEPTPEEVAAARQKLAQWAEETVRKADRMWSMTQKITDISDDAKLAAGVIAVEREWASDWTAIEKVACPACGEPMNKGARIHSVGQKGCGQRISYDESGKAFWADEKRMGPTPASQK